MEKDNDEILLSTKIRELSVDKNQVVILVNVFMPLICSRVQRATMKKTLTIPKWIDDLAEENYINFSQVLQDALRERLYVKDPF